MRVEVLDHGVLMALGLRRHAVRAADAKPGRRELARGVRRRARGRAGRHVQDLHLRARDRLAVRAHDETRDLRARFLRLCQRHGTQREREPDARGDGRCGEDRRDGGGEADRAATIGHGCGSPKFP